MEFYQVINNRRTIRDLKAEPVSADVLERIIAAGIQAPTHDHMREWEFVILREEEENAFASVWCCIENIFLAAVAEGLACSMRIPVGNKGLKVADSVHAPTGYMLPCYIGLGYPATDVAVLEQIECPIKNSLTLYILVSGKTEAKE